jgi:predicted transporter
MYTWGILAVVALPIFLLAQFCFLIRALKEGREDSARSLFFLSAFAFCFGAIGECIFLLSRR